MTALSTNIVNAPKAGVFARIADAVNVFFAATRATAAIRAERQPQAADLKVLGISPDHKFNF